MIYLLDSVIQSSNNQGEKDTGTFFVFLHLHVFLPVSCCVKRKCWCFVTEGMGAANQEEMVKCSLYSHVLIFKI